MWLTSHKPRWKKSLLLLCLEVIARCAAGGVRLSGMIVEMHLISEPNAPLFTVTSSVKTYSKAFCRYIPFFGLATWLLVDGSSLSKGIRSGFWDSHEEKP